MNEKVIEKKLVECSISYQAHIVGSVADPEETASHLKAVLNEYRKDGDCEALKLALKNIAQFMVV